VSGPAPLGVYLHWPFCARICPYCDFNVYRQRRGEDEVEGVVAAMLADLSAQRALTGPRRLVSIFFGGGTPSLLPPEAAARLIERCTTLWAAEPDLEISLEANPTDAERGRFADLAAVGVNRLSLGLQSLVDADLAFLGRNHDAAEGRRAVDAALSAFRRVSVDLIYALPGQTEAGWSETLSCIAGLGVEHVSPYQLTIEPGTAFDRAVGRGRFTPPDADLAARLFEATDAVLSASGFEAYEVSNHARGDEARSRHNLVYWRGEDYVGAGPGAHGRISTAKGRLATVAEARPADYVARVAAAGPGFAETETLSPVAIAEERLLMGLRTDEGVAFTQLSALGLGPDHAEVRALIALGLVIPDDQRLRVARRGRALLDAVTRRLILS
jgi:oxygen-independent coproporphyrinogen-3 oxidase